MRLEPGRNRDVVTLRHCNATRCVVGHSGALALGAAMEAAARSNVALEALLGIAPEPQEREWLCLRARTVDDASQPASAQSNLSCALR